MKSSRNEEHHHFSGIRRVVLIPMTAKIGLRLGGSDEDMKTGNKNRLSGGIRRVALIQAVDLSCGLRPLVNRMKKSYAIKI